MSSDKRSGIKAHLTKLGADMDVPVDPEDEQHDIFGHEPLLPTLVVPGKDTVKRKRGRPLGSKDRKTEQLIKLVTTKYGHPVLRLAELAATPVHILAATLDCTMLEAAEFSRKCQNDLAGYVAQKLPQMVQIEQKTAGVLHVHLGQPPAEGQEMSAEGIPIILQTPEKNSEQNQELIDVTPEKSQTESRTDDASD